MSWFFSPLKPCHYQVILADPATHWQGYSPWDSTPYAVMSDAWLRDLPVENLAAADCLMMLWTTMPKLKFSLELLELWGFRYVTAGAWFKRTVNGKIALGRGKVLQSGAENYLLGARGRPPYAKKPVRGAIDSEGIFDAQLAEVCRVAGAECISALRREHSRKPDEQYEILETLMGDVPRCELFSHTDREGWDAWGDQVGLYGSSGPGSFPVKQTGEV